MVTIAQLRTKLGAAIAVVPIANFDGKEDLVLSKVTEEINAVISPLSSDSDKLNALNHFGVIFDEFVAYLNDKYSAQTGRIDGNLIAPYIKSAIKNIISTLVIPVEG